MKRDLADMPQDALCDEGRCLNITPSAAHSALAPFRILRSCYDGLPRTYCHRDYFVLYYTEKGYVTLRAEGQEIRLGYGDIAIAPPERRHTVSLCTADSVIYECAFTIGWIEDILKTRAGTGGTLSRIFNSGRCAVIQPVPADLQLHLGHMMEFMVYAAQKRDSECAIKNCLATLLCVYSSLYRAGEAAPEAAEKNSVVYAVHYIKGHYAEALTVDAMAELTRMSRKEFCRRFRRFTGKTMHEFLNGVRIAKALEVIAASEGRLSLSALAGLCGYADYTTFYRNFQRIVGETPASYLSARRAPKEAEG